MTAAMPEPQPNDVALIARWQAGEEAAAAELVRRHAGPVARFLAGAGAGDEVEDLVQEAFFRAFRHIRGYRRGASFRTWVMAIAANALTDHRRRRGRRPVVSLGEHDVVDERADPHGELIGGELVRRVEAAVGLLPPMQRNVFLLRAQQGLDYEAIARALDTSPGAARVHYHHAVKRIRRALDVEAVVPGRQTGSPTGQERQGT